MDQDCQYLGNHKGDQTDDPMSSDFKKSKIEMAIEEVFWLQVIRIFLIMSAFHIYRWLLSKIHALV